MTTQSGKHASASHSGSSAAATLLSSTPPTRPRSTVTTATMTTATRTTTTTTTTTDTSATASKAHTPSSSSSSSSRFWLFAFRDHLAGLHAYSNALCTADVSGNGDYKLLVADGSQRLKVYSGTSLHLELRLPGVPTAITSFYMADDNNSGNSSSSKTATMATSGVRRPVVAVAVGPYIFMYHDLKPLYRYTLPDVPLRAAEVCLWRALVEETLSIDEAMRQLEALRAATRLGSDATRQALAPSPPSSAEEGDEEHDGIVAGDVCARLTELLLLDKAEERVAFVRRMRGVPLREADVVTCMATLPLHRSDAAVASLSSSTSSSSSATAAAAAAGTLVMGTERRYLYVLHENMTDMVVCLRLASTPVALLLAGCLYVDYRVLVSCRDGRIYMIKNGALSATVLQPSGPLVGMARYDHYVAVATCDRRLSYYTLKGQAHASLTLQLPITNLVALTDTVTDAARALVVALGSGEVRVYAGTRLQHVSQAYGSVTAMLYSRYSREDAALVLVLQNGSLMVQLVHRQAMLTLQHDGHARASDADAAATLSGAAAREAEAAAAASPSPMPVPKLSSVFDECTARERAHGADMYTSFRRAYCHLELQTARAYLSVLRSSRGDGQGSSNTAQLLLTPPPSSSVVQATTHTSHGDAHEAHTHAVTAAVARPVVRLTTALYGSGPTFRLSVALRLVDTSRASVDELLLLVMPDRDDGVIVVDKAVQPVAYLTAHSPRQCTTLLRVTAESTCDDGVVVLLVHAPTRRLLATAHVTLPDVDAADWP